MRSGRCRSALIGLVASLAAAGAAAGQEPNCVRVAGQNLSPGEIYDSRHACGTCPGQKAKARLCAVLNHAMVPNWAAPSDILSVPHRGVWGQPLSRGAPENTSHAIIRAHDAGYKVIEIDVALTGPDERGRREVFLGHYFSLAATNGRRDLSPSNLPPNRVYAERMNYRDQTPSLDYEDRLLSFDLALRYAKANDLVLMVDPKVPEKAAPDEHEQILAYVLNEARAQDALANVVLKTRRFHYDVVAMMAPHLDAPFAEFAGRFLWSPITAAGVDEKRLGEVLGFIDAWAADTGASRQIMVFETNLFSPSYAGAMPFTYRGTRYENLIDYVRGLTPLGKRSALWSLDPMGDKGTLGRVYNWKFVGNEPDDRRGNPLVTLGYRYAPHALVTTDRPEWYQAFVESGEGDDAAR